MASVSSLDSDMRNLRMSRYTPTAVNETRSWIEDSLGEKLPAGDLLEALKDGVALCKLANLATGPPGIKYKQSSMPFMQMENISHFLRVCEAPPLNLHAHDRFLTVDLFESKDPAQVLQCLSAFSRAASVANPGRFPTTIGGRRSGAMSPSSVTTPGRNTSPLRVAASMSNMRPTVTSPYTRPLSPTKTGGSATSSTTGPVSSWSKKTDEGVTAPAWNIAQYGYMGGASQGNQGVSFGGRRQITSAGPSIPNLAEKQKKRAEKEAEEQRLKQEAEEAEQRRRKEQEEEEERRWEAETKRQREQERQRLEQQKREWEEQEKRWNAEEEARQREEAEEKKARPGRLANLNGQYLSQYQADESKAATQETETPESRRVKELEKQLQEAKEREKQYQLEREQRSHQPRSAEPPKRVDSQERPQSSRESEASWAPDERETLRQAAPQRLTGFGSNQPLPASTAPREVTPEPETRPSPDSPEHTPRQQNPSRTEQYLAQNRAPTFQRPKTHQPAEMGFSSTLEEQQDRDRRIASQDSTKAGGWASKSLLEREMERERDRQKEWEANQEATRAVARDIQEGSAPGQTWNVNQYGFTGGDSQNRGSGAGSGIAFGGRRQIIGPRPQPGARS